MQLSPLQLLEYTFGGVSVMPVDGYVADPEFPPALVFFPGKLALTAETSLQQLNEENNYSDFKVSLKLCVAPKEGAEAPYQVQVFVSGVVRIHLSKTDGQAEERRVRAFVNGVSLLYGVIREMVVNITSRSVHGQFLLPSLNFADLADLPPDSSKSPLAPALAAAKPKVKKQVKAKTLLIK